MVKTNQLTLNVGRDSGAEVKRFRSGRVYAQGRNKGDRAIGKDRYIGGNCTRNSPVNHLLVGNQ